MQKDAVVRAARGMWVLLAVLVGACAHRAMPVENETRAQIELLRSSKHEFTDVVAYVDDENKQLVVFGKVKHTHDDCLEEGHADLVVSSQDGRVLHRRSLSIVNRGEQRGWHGAAFRTRIPLVPTAEQQVRLGFHDAECVVGESFDCGENVAQKP